MNTTTHDREPRRPDALLDVLMKRDGMEQQEAELLIDSFRTNLASLLSEAGAEMEEDDADIFGSAQDLFADEFDVDLDYLDEFWEEAKGEIGGGNLATNDGKQERTPFYWTRGGITKEKREWTSRRIKAAERAIQREKDKTPLFPELAPDQTVDERRRRMDEREEEMKDRLRNHRAKGWWEVRRYLRTLDGSERDRLLQKWNSKYCPGDPAYFFATARMLGIEPAPPNPFEEEDGESGE